MPQLTLVGGPHGLAGISDSVACSALAESSTAITQIGRSVSERQVAALNCPVELDHIVRPLDVQ